MKEYLKHLLALRPGLVAGVVSSPQIPLLVRLVNLVEAETFEQSLQDHHEISSCTLMRRMLQPDEHSALFLKSSLRNQIFQEAGTVVYFFFLRISKQEVARVEIPA